MRSHVAFLRGVNVGGNAVVPMRRLIAIAETLELASVKTLLQSGNLLFSAPDERIDEVRQRLGAGIEAEFGFRPAVIMRSRAEIERVIETMPFGGNEVDGSRLLTVFLSSAPTDAQIGQLESARFPDVSYAIIGQEMHILYGNGMGSSKFVPAYYERKLGTVGTARNWNTVTKILALLRD